MIKLLIISLLVLPLTSFGEDFVIDASVISSEPITTTRVTETMLPGCRAGRPNTNSFERLLNWDLGCELSRQEEITSYRVMYRFQGETFAMMADRQPGDTIPVKITLN